MEKFVRFQAGHRLSIPFPLLVSGHLGSPPTPPRRDLGALRRNALRRLAKPPNAAAQSESYLPAAVNWLFLTYFMLPSFLLITSDIF